MRRPLPALGAVLAVAAVLATPGTALAGEPLAPGGSQTLDVPLPAGWATDVDRLGVSVSALTQWENDCVEPESESGDDTCGDEEGELADFLEATVAGGVDGETGCRATGEGVPLALIDGVASRFDVEGVNCLVLRLEFPDGGSADPDNLAQSDSITFSLGVVGEEELAPPSDDDETTTAEDPVDGATSDGATSGGAASGNAATSSGGGAAAAAGGPVGTGTTTGSATAAGGGAGGAAAAGGATPAGAPAPVDAGTSVAADGPVVGRVDTPVTVDDGGVAVATESASTSIVGQALAWGSTFLGAVVLGGLVFVVVRRRRSGRAA
ncbi:hypothetical protein [Geodermatophilus sp. CPCC 206100]|uniref:hypothetical protein n=1 Tax=Geodermatophilus sp. CPCC 206100 TaxID=3020054 RepID=UPI003B008F3A